MPLLLLASISSYLDHFSTGGFVLVKLVSTNNLNSSSTDLRTLLCEPSNKRTHTHTHTHTYIYMHKPQL